MYDRLLTAVALVLTASSLAAQAPAQKPAPVKPAAPARRCRIHPPSCSRAWSLSPAACNRKGTTSWSTRLSPRRRKRRSRRLRRCLQYQIEGLSGARLSLLVGKRVNINGVYQEAPAGKGGTTNANALPRFEATNATEVEGVCSSAG